MLGALAALVVSPATAQDDLPAKLVSDLHSAFGEHHARAVHAKGIVLTGNFTPDAGARSLSKAAIFTRPIAVTVRFSDFTGIPNIPDADPNASPRGMAIKFGPADDATMDIVAHGFNGFPVKTAAEFGELFHAVGTSGPGVAKPTSLDRFLGAHPIAATFLTTQKPAPESYATNAYFGVNAFSFTDAKGHATAVRYRFVPAAGEHYLDAAALKQRAPGYLATEIAKRVKAGPIRFDWFAQIAAPGDRIDDPSIAWPNTRRLVKLGTITITKLSADQAGDDKRLIFLPNNVPSGIAPADPMIAVRSAAYPISFGERQ
ncbi:catalase family peroxidase [Polymorphobacter megasporae]|nr:catalase family peroxidase [Polymorphobacter megasporae]